MRRCLTAFEFGGVGGPAWPGDTSKEPAYGPFLLPKGCGVGLPAELIKCHLQIVGNQLGAAAFNVVALQHVYQLAIPKQGDAGAAGRVGQ